ncbi:MAG: DNA gyrase subunit A [Xanthobacteraceae bacterium]
MVLPARFPGLLVNGAGGIAVGMATNIPPHNLGEVIDAAVAIDDPALGIDDLIQIVPGRIPHRRRDPRPARHPHRLSHFGRGSIVMRGKVEFETRCAGARAIVVHGNSVSGEQGDDGGEDRRTGAGEDPKALPISAMNPTARATAW